MKNSILLFLLLVSVLTACQQASDTSSARTFGKPVDTTSVLTVDQALTGLATADHVTCTVTGTVNEVCQGEGCWFNVKASDGTSLLVLTQDKSFSVPKDMSGQSVFFQGDLHWEKNEEADSVANPRIAVLDASGVSIR